MAREGVKKKTTTKKISMRRLPFLTSVDYPPPPKNTNNSFVTMICRKVIKKKKTPKKKPPSWSASCSWSIWRKVPLCLVRFSAWRWPFRPL